FWTREWEAGRSKSAPPPMDPQSMVTGFHRAMGLPVASAPTVGTPEQRALRVRLMLEEVLEFADAANVQIIWNSATDSEELDVNRLSFHGLGGPDLVQMTHELADVQY